MEYSFQELLHRIGIVTLYGNKISGTSLGKADVLKLGGLGSPQMAEIHSFSIAGRCVKLPINIVLIVNGDGNPVTETDKCGNAGELYWELLQSEELIRISISRGPALELIDSIQSKDISGGLTIENPNITNGQLCGTVHAWYDISVFGQDIKDDKRIPFCIPLQGCYTIYDFGIGTIEACVSAAASHGVNLCLKLCVGKWGINKCWDACAYVGLPSVGASSEPASKSPCACSG